MPPGWGMADNLVSWGGWGDYVIHGTDSTLDPLRVCVFSGTKCVRMCSIVPCVDCNGVSAAPFPTALIVQGKHTGVRMFSACNMLSTLQAISYHTDTVAIIGNSVIVF